MTNSKNVLIIDDDITILNMLAELIKDLRPNFNITKFSSAVDAKAEIEKSNTIVDLIISDINMPDLTGVELAQFVIELKKPIRLFLMSGNINLINYLELFELGVEKIFSKPFSMNEILEHIDNPLPIIECSFKEMIPVKITSLLQLEFCPFDLYVGLGSNKLIKIFKSNEFLNYLRLNQFLEKNITYLYAGKTSYQKMTTKLYVPVRLSNLKSNLELPFCVYYQKDSDFTRIIEQSTLLSNTILEVITKRNIKQLYIEDKDEPLFLEYLEKTLKSYMNSADNSIDEKLLTASDVLGAKVQNFFNNISVVNFIALTNTQKTMQGFISENQDALSQLNTLIKKDKSNHAHATRVASLSFAILLELNRMRENDNLKNSIKALDEYIFESNEIKSAIFTGALLHDIGKSVLQFSDDIAFDLDLQQSDEYSERLLSHPIIAIKKLSDFKSFPPIALDIIAQHEEFNDGSGYPKKLKKPEINFFSQVVILANFYDRQVTVNNLTDSEAITVIKQNAEKFNKYLLLVLERVILKI